MPVFSLLKDPVGYHPCSTENMRTDPEYLAFWLDHFEHHFDTLVEHAVEVYGEEARGRAAACKREFVRILHAVREDHEYLGPELHMLRFDKLRQDLLVAHGLPDPYEAMKRRENAAMAAIYPRVVAELDRHTSEYEALLLATEGVFAGNIFDVGARATAEMFARVSPDFIAVRDELGGKRPWLVDHFDALARRLLKGPRHRKAMFFCDNAGSDCILGVIPFCRLLALRGTTVLIAANHSPALNDVTYTELRDLLPRLGAVDPTLARLLAEGRIGAIDSGDDCPLIDLRLVSEEVDRHAPDTDLVILEGMGRAVESNFAAAFTVDALKLAMIKIEMVARRHGGKIFDTVCRFDPA